MSTSSSESDSSSTSREVILSGPTDFAEKILSKISNLLTKNNRNEKVGFCVEKELPVSSIDVTVKNTGKLQFPLSEEFIKKLTSNSTKAKFRKGDQTLLDKMACDPNEIKANKLNVKMNNNLFEKILNEIGQRLGLLETTSLKPHLCNMLICGPGQGFKHQNVKQINGTIATLIIVLPVEHVGGDLTVKHNKEKHVFCSEDVDANNFKCAAFYSDCYRTTKNIKQGYQIVLIYNLISSPKVTCYSHYSNLELEKLMKMYFSDEKVNKFNDLHLIYFLDHSYTEQNLRWNMLRGIDIKNGSAMYNAAQILNLVPHLALVEITRKSADHDEYGDEISFDEEDMEVNFWIDSNNEKVLYTKLTSESTCCTTKTKNFEPYIEEEVEDDETDVLMNVCRYRRAAIVLWPASNDVHMKFVLNCTKEKNDSKGKFKRQKVR